LEQVFSIPKEIANPTGRMSKKKKTLRLALQMTKYNINPAEARLDHA